MTLEDAREKFDEALNLEDVAEKRLLMYRAFEDVLDALDKESINDLDGFDGVLYKASQDFLLASGTFEKKEKLEKIIEHVERRYS